MLAAVSSRFAVPISAGAGGAYTSPADPVTELLPLPKDCADLLALLTGQPKDQCPFCRLGRMQRIEVLPPIRWPDSS